MAARTPLNFPRFRAFDSNGGPLSGGKVYFYETGTTTAKTTWSDPDLTVANTQPVVLDSAGEADIYLNDQAYKIVLDDADDVQQWTLDEYVRSNSAFSGNVDPPHATDSGTDAFTGNSGLTLQDGQVYTWDFQSANTTTTPTLNDNSQGAKTIKRRNGIAVLIGDITGVHRLEYDGTDYIILDPTLGYDSNPADATDGGTDAFTANSGRTLVSGQTYKFDFQSSNATTTPTLDGRTITDIAGNALWAGALNRVHDLLYDGTNYRVVDPIPNTDVGTDAIAQLDKFTAGHIDGLELSNNGTDSDHDIDIATGVCSMRDGSGNRKLFELTSGLTKQIDANWAEGSAAGGFPSGLTLSADTWYRVFLIGKDDGTVDVGFDTDASATNLLADATAYSWFRQIRWETTDGSSNIVATLQKSDHVFIDTVANDITNNNPGTSAVLAAVTVPPDQVGIIGAMLEQNSAGEDASIIITSPDVSDVAPSPAGLGQLRWSNNGQQSTTAEVLVKVNSSSQIRYRVQVSDTDITFWAFAIGWIDDRGRNA